MSDIKIFTGNSNPVLADLVAKYLNIKISSSLVSRFSDGEINIRINENVRGKDVFLIQSICFPVNDNLMELLIMTDALRRASAGRITAVIPYFGYARQDRRVCSSRVPITAKVVSDFLSNVGVDRILTIDLHSEQIQGFFDIPVDNIFATKVFIEDIKNKSIGNISIVSPDFGGIIRARSVSQYFKNVNISIIDKYRKRANFSEVMHIIGDVVDKNCILIDDILDTGGTLCKAAQSLKFHGAKTVIAYVTHPIFSGDALVNINNSLIDELIICDTIPLFFDVNLIKKIRIKSISYILSESIRRISNEESISSMFI